MVWFITSVLLFAEDHLLSAQLLIQVLKKM